ncbi:MAG: M20/M25/M40 family metallo-hydrolase [Pontixanthobacter sp.]
MKNWTALILVLAAAFGLAIFGTTPPAPVPATANPAEFSAGRAMVDVQIIAKAPHSTGTAENAAVRGHIAARLDALGLEVETTQGPVDQGSVDRLNSWSGLGQPSLTWVNIIGTLPGKDRSLPAVLLMAHHDTVWGSPGAADDTAGVASILEVVRAIRHRGQPARDIMVLITDAEELGLVGARAFFANDPLPKRVGAVINLEARGGGGRTTLFQTSANNGNAVARYRANVNRPAGSSLAAFIYSVLPNDTDLTPALQGDYAAYNFAFIGRSGLYHSPLATPERLDQGALQDMGAQVLALTGALAVAKPLPAAAPDTVFFDVFGLFMITYPVWVGWLLLALGAGGVVLGFRGNSNGPAILGGAGRMFALVRAPIITTVWQPFRCSKQLPGSDVWQFSFSVSGIGSTLSPG